MRATITKTICAILLYMCMYFYFLLFLSWRLTSPLRLRAVMMDINNDRQRPPTQYGNRMQFRANRIDVNTSNYRPLKATTTGQTGIKKMAKIKTNAIVVSDPSTTKATKTTMRVAPAAKRMKIPVIKSGYALSKPPPFCCCCRSVAFLLVILTRANGIKNNIVPF